MTELAELTKYACFIREKTKLNLLLTGNPLGTFCRKKEGEKRTCRVIYGIDD